jgi:hypothetical protein
VVPTVREASAVQPTAATTALIHSTGNGAEFHEEYRQMAGDLSRSWMLLTPMTLAPLFTFCGGRSTFFALLFAITGITLAFLRHLDGNFALLASALQAFIVAHSAKEDYFDKDGGK